MLYWSIAGLMAICAFGALTMIGCAIRASGYASTIANWMAATSGWAQLIVAAAAAWFAYGQLVEMQRSSAVQSSNILRQYLSDANSELRTMSDSFHALNKFEVLEAFADRRKSPPEWSAAYSRSFQSAVGAIGEIVQKTTEFRGTIATADVAKERNALFESETAVIRNFNSMIALGFDASTNEMDFHAELDRAHAALGRDFADSEYAYTRALEGRIHEIEEQLSAIEGRILGK